MNFRLPSAWTVVIGAALGVATALNDQVLHLGPPWTSGLNMIILWAGVFGVSVLTGGALRTIIKLTQAEAAFGAGALSVVQLVLMQSDLTSWLRTALQVIVVLAATLGIGTDTPIKVLAERSSDGAREGLS